MTIGINGYEAVVPRFGFDKKTSLPNRVGSVEYCFQILTELARIDKKNNYIIFLPQKPSPDMPSESENWKYKVISSKLWTILGKLVFLSKPNLGTTASYPFIPIVIKY